METNAQDFQICGRDLHIHLVIEYDEKRKTCLSRDLTGDASGLRGFRRSCGRTDASRTSQCAAHIFPTFRE